MRAAKVILVIWLLCELALWIRGEQGFSVIDALPFAQRPKSFSPDYEWLALGALLIGLWGYAMMRRRKPDQQAQQVPTGRPQLRTSVFLVPLSIIGLAALSRRFHSTLRFSELVGDPARLTEHRYLAVLCVVVFASVLAIAALRNR